MLISNVRGKKPRNNTGLTESLFRKSGGLSTPTRYLSPVGDTRHDSRTPSVVPHGLFHMDGTGRCDRAGRAHVSPSTLNIIPPLLSEGSFVHWVVLSIAIIHSSFEFGNGRVDRKWQKPAHSSVLVSWHLLFRRNFRNGWHRSSFDLCVLARSSGIAGS